jgi:hypothetical protein
MSIEIKENLSAGEEIVKDDFEARLIQLEKEMKEVAEDIRKNMKPLKDVLKEIEEGRKQNTNSKPPTP